MDGGQMDLGGEARERTNSIGGGEMKSRRDGCDGAQQQGGRALHARLDGSFLLVESAAFRMVFFFYNGRFITHKK
jgi:hypothetical protein